MDNRFYYISNVFEESVKFQRGILTDSPAATRKVTTLCRAVRQAGGEAEIISLGRGRSRGTWKSYPVIAAQAGMVPITYLRYFDAPIITHLVTMFSLLAVVMNKTGKDSVFVFYNVSMHYLLALLFCWLTGNRCILDIEDGYRKDDTNFRSLLNLWLMKLHNKCCRAGAMLAATVLQDQASGQCTYVCYGVADFENMSRDWLNVPIQVHLGGSLLEETGAALFLETLELMMRTKPEVLKKLRFVVTGFGPYADAVSQLASGSMENCLHFYGNVTSADYINIIQHSHVGLCLKMPGCSMSATTFPSKVIELTSNGLLLISTRVSDVPLLFDETTAVLLDTATPTALVEALERIAQHPEKAHGIAMTGQNMVISQFSEEKVGKELLQFWQGSSAKNYV